MAHLLTIIRRSRAFFLLVSSERILVHIIVHRLEVFVSHCMYTLVALSISGDFRINGRGFRLFFVGDIMLRGLVLTSVVSLPPGQHNLGTNLGFHGGTHYRIHRRNLEWKEFLGLSMQELTTDRSNY